MSKLHVRLMLHESHSRIDALSSSTSQTTYFVIYENISCHLCPSQGSTCRKCSLTGFVLCLHPGGCIIGRWSLTGSENPFQNSSYIVSTDTQNVVLPQRERLVQASCSIDVARVTQPHRRCQLLDLSNHSFVIYENISCHLCPSQGSTCRKCSLTGLSSACTLEAALSAGGPSQVPKTHSKTVRI